jgi:hypothetical protein
MRREAEIASHLSHRAVTNYTGLFVEADQTFNGGADFYLVDGFRQQRLLHESIWPKIEDLKLLRSW